MMHVLLPLDVFKVHYEVAVGRPYSRLEQLLLRLIGEDGGQEGRTFEEFRGTFHVHDRLLTEALVTLLREGWVAMTQTDDEIRYLATEEGMLTISHGRRPARLQVQQREVSLARELLSCQLARLSDLDALRTEEVRKRTGHWAASYSLEARHQRKTLNGGEAEWLLPRNADEQQWIRRIDPDARALRGRYCLPLQVDLDAGEVVGLPAPWSHLKPRVLEATEKQYEELALDGEAQQRFDTYLQPQIRGEGRPARRREKVSSLPDVEVSCADVALTAGEARRLAESVLQRATGHVLFVVSALDQARAVRVSELAAELQERGVHVDVLWSHDSGPEGSVKELVNALGASRTGGSAGKLLFNRTPAQVAADLVLAVTQDGPVAVVGEGVVSCDADEGRPSPAVRLRHVQVLSAVASLAAGWWQEVPDETTEVLAGRWRHLAERWVEQAAKYGTPHPAEVASGESDCDGVVSVYIGSQGRLFSEDVLRSGAGVLVSEAEGPARVVASKEEWVVGAGGSVPATLGFRLQGHPAVQLWHRADGPSPYPSGGDTEQA